MIPLARLKKLMVPVPDWKGPSLLIKTPLSKAPGVTLGSVFTSRSQLHKVKIIAMRLMILKLKVGFFIGLNYPRAV